ncbi:MAG TPA: hypothetical protein VFD64_20870 [Gemmatimonadaceae bacterium]|nr:hypothetical protein [Gemmatimonadaceae bacterium]
MTEERLNELLDDARRTWPLPPEPDYTAMWGRIEREAFSGIRPGQARTPSWRTFSLGLAATLVIGVSLGRLSARDTAAPTGAAVADAATESATPASNAYDKVAQDLLGRTVALLTSLPVESRNVGAGEHFSNQAIELLTSTRLLIDSPAASDARFKDLLEDLELVLAQIAMLQSGRTRQEIDLITDALEERDVVPRIQSAVARLARGD